MENIHIETNNEEAFSIKSEIIPYNKLNHRHNNPNNSKSNQSLQNTNFKTKSSVSKQMNSISNKDASLSKIQHTESTKPTNKFIFEKEVLQQIEDFRFKLNQKLLNMLSEEKQKEENRERALIECHDKKERIRLEKLFGMERAQAAHKINYFNEQLEMKIVEYERNLRNNKVKG